MATAAGAFTAYSSLTTEQIGNREDLGDKVWDLTPADTPFLSSIGRGKASAINHEWVTDTLTTGTPAWALEGGDASPNAPSPRTRLGNYTGVMVKHSVVSGTQEKVSKAGVRSEHAFQIPRRIQEMKTDIETACLTDNAKVGGQNTTAREFGSLSTYISNGVAGDEFAATTSANPTGDGSDVPTKTGTDRTFTETIWGNALENLYTASGGSENILAFVTASHKSLISGFTASSSRYVTTDDKKLVASIDVYDGDYHTVSVIPDRFCQANSLYLVDPKYIKLAELRSMHTTDLSVQGDSTRKQIIWEGTLEVCDPVAHSHVFDLT